MIFLADLSPTKLVQLVLQLHKNSSHTIIFTGSIRAHVNSQPLSFMRTFSVASLCSVFYKHQETEAEPVMTFPESTLVQSDSGPWTNTTDDIIVSIKCWTPLWH